MAWAQRLRTLLSCSEKSDWGALGHFIFRIRQLRRKFRANVERLELQYEKNGFAARKAAWKMKGNFVCNHGVFFLKAQGLSCPCMDQGASAADVWKWARWMPHLHPELRAITVMPFDHNSFLRIGVLRAQLRRKSQ
eukprot:5332276-Karenia_brevis.AAC.1